MPVISLMGAKGGVGTSLIAANLAIMLAAKQRCMLLDLNPVAGGLDLLLGLEPSKSWADLLPVADEMTDRHLELATVSGSDGLYLLAAPRQPVEADPNSLLPELSSRFHWLVVDLGNRMMPWHSEMLSASDVILLVTTLDPPALRGSQWWLAAVSDGTRSNVELVVNQWTTNHPVDPKSLAESLGVELATVLPYSSKEIADQINYGRPIAARSSGGYRRGLQRLVRRLQKPEPASAGPQATRS